MFSGILIFDPNRQFCMDYSLCKMADFQNGLISEIFGVFSSGSLKKNSFNGVVESISACFLKYGLCKMADIQNGLISGIFGVFSSGLLHRTTLMGF